MSGMSELLKAEHVGIREFKENFSQTIKKRKPTILTLNGQPTQVLVPYDEFVELLEVLEELQDANLKREVEDARRAFREHGGVPAEDVFTKHAPKV